MDCRFLHNHGIDVDGLTLDSHLLTQTDLGHEVCLLFLWRCWKRLLLKGEQRRTQLLGGRCRGCNIVRLQLRRAPFDLFLILAYNDAYELAGVIRVLDGGGM